MLFLSFLHSHYVKKHPPPCCLPLHGSSHAVCSTLTVRIGAMLAYTPLDEKSLALLLSYLQDFLK